MESQFFDEFLTSDDTLRVYKEDGLVFSSNKDGLLPLIDYIDKFATSHKQVGIFDKIMGNAVALLSIEAGCRKVYSPIGSELAIRTLENYGIEYHLNEVVPYIQNRSGEDMCPMEKLSIDKSPGEFYEAVRTSFTQRRE
ncbi:DUF1893 domain-containing protein [Chloroflexota bacterium]